MSNINRTGRIDVIVVGLALVALVACIFLQPVIVAIGEVLDHLITSLLDWLRAHLVCLDRACYRCARMLEREPHDWAGRAIILALIVTASGL